MHFVETITVFIAGVLSCAVANALVNISLKWTPLSRQLLVEFKVDSLRLLSLTVAGSVQTFF